MIKPRFPFQQSNLNILGTTADLFCIIVGIGTSFAVHLVGDIYVAEILLAFAFPILIGLRGRRALRRDLRIFYFLMGLWLLGLVISDAYNQIPIVDRMRGAALIVFFAMNLVGMSILLSHNERRKVLYFTGLMIGALAAVKLQPSSAAESYPWKFGYAAGSILLVMLVSSFLYGRRRLIISAIFVLGICGVNLIMNYRSPILILLLTLVLVYEIIPERVAHIQILPHSRLPRILVLGILAIAAAKLAGTLVDLVTESGYISEEAQAKNEAQSKGGNLLLGGRPEFVVGLRAALDSPIVGHGSWPKDFKYTEMLNDMLVETGAQDYVPDLEEEDGLIPAHSHVVAAWVWAGITGLIFWLYIAWLVCRGIVSIAILRPPLAPLYMFLLIGFLWDIFFSPFAATRRISEAALMIIIADLLQKKAPVARFAWKRRHATIPRAVAVQNRLASPTRIR